MVYKSIQIYGQVQAVGFRYYTATMAGQMGVRGWVRNRSDGSVEVEAEAPENVMTEFIHILEKGPLFARVDRMVVKEISGTKEWRGFSIR